jgi:hypothetical protein
MKPTHLTQLTSYCLLSSCMGQNVSWEDSGYFWKHYSTLHATWVVITVFSSPTTSLYIVPDPCSPHIAAVFTEDLFSFFPLNYV